MTREIVGSTVLSLMLLAGAACSIDTFIVYMPTTVDRYTLPHNHIPEHLVEDPHIVTEDGVTLGARLALQEDGANHASVIYLHGQAENLDDAWVAVMRLWDVGYNVLAIDYRGFGTSGGEPTEAGLYRDADAAMSSLVADDRMDPERIVIWGFSLGSGVASMLATRASERALVLESAYTSMVDMVEQSAPMTIPSTWIAEAQLDTESRIDEVDSPVVLGHGTDDARVPYWMAERLYRTAQDPRVLVTIAGAGHGDVLKDARGKMLDALGSLDPLALP